MIVGSKVKRGSKAVRGRARPFAGFTLLELLLSLSLIVVATVLIGSLMNLYARSFTSRGDDIRRKQLARSLLTMIGDDIRSVVQQQPYDKSVLEQMLGGGAGAAGGVGGGTVGGGATGGNAPGGNGGGRGNTGGGNTGGGSGNTVGGNANNRNTGGGNSGRGGQTGGGQSGGGSSSQVGSGSNSGAAAGETGAANDPTEEQTTILPPGVYGNRNQLMIDVSRLPRSDQYNPAAASQPIGTLVDVPGDVKTVTYLLQASGVMGVQDRLSQLSPAADGKSAAMMNTGLVRRQLDRAVSSYAEEMGQSMQMMASGDLVAPEVVSIDFAYYDGTQWTYEWDSSLQGLPWLVQVTLALQSDSGFSEMPASGVSLQTLTLEDQKRYGIETFELTVAIPGAKLQASASGTNASTASGLSSAGL